MAGIEDLSPQDQQAHRLGALLLRKSPDIARKAKRLAREADPTLIVPELDLEDQLEKSAKTQDEKLEAMDKQLMEERVARRKTERDQQIKDAGFTVAEIEKIIVDEKCTYETALKIAALQQQTAEPTAGEVRHGGNQPGTPIDMRPEADWRKLGTNRAALQRRSHEVASEMITNFNKGRRAAR
jgi:hypothetical protein